VLPVAAGAQHQPAPPLESLRLLPPVPLKGEEGWSLAERMRHHRVEAVSVALIRDFRVAWETAVGLADRGEGKRATAETLFQAGSISKPVAAAALLREAEKGTFRLDADVNDFLKSWKLPANELTAQEKVTLERILSHGAGLTVHGFPGYAAGASVPTVPQILDGAPPANTPPVRVDLVPGSRWRYSGGGYTIAQLAMSDTLGRPFPDLTRTLLLAPAGMSRSTYEQPLPASRVAEAAAGYRRDGSAVPGKWHVYPEMAAAGLWTTAGDLARFAVAIQKSLRGDEGSLLSRPTAERMVTPFIGEYALGFGVETHASERYFSHGGADEGFQAYLVAHRGGWGAAVMANSDNGVALAVEILRGLARQEGWKGYLPEPLEPVALSADDLRALPGRYKVTSDEALSVESRDGRVFGRGSADPEFELVPVEGDRLARKDRAIRYGVLRSNGAVRALAIERDDARSEAPRMAPGETIPFDHVLAGRLEEATASIPTPRTRGTASARCCCRTASEPAPSSATARCSRCCRGTRRRTKLRRPSSVPTPSARSKSCRPSRSSDYASRWWAKNCASCRRFESPTAARSDCISPSPRGANDRARVALRSSSSGRGIPTVARLTGSESA
jgi:CubicO group peptidase (beta-lactamase class C family)